MFLKLTPCITELRVLFYILFMGHCITRKGLMSLDNVGKNIFKTAKGRFHSKEDKSNEKRIKIPNLESNLRL